MRVAVVGGGISGLTAAFEAQKLGHEVTLLEAGDRFGGLIQTTRTELPGWGELLLENGAESAILARPHARDLALELGLQPQSTRQRYRGTRILRKGRLETIPDGLRLMAPAKVLPFLFSKVMSPLGKLRVYQDLFLPRSPQPPAQDESVADFVRRRLGTEALERLAQPMLAGIYTADPEQLSLLATQPEFRQLEHRYGSVIRGLVKSPAARASAGQRHNLFFSLPGGMQQLTDGLVTQLGENARLNSPVEALEATADGYRLVGKESFEAERVVLAMPAYRAAALVAGVDRELARQLEQIQYLSSATVNLVYPLDTLGHETAAFGFVVPQVERRDILACTYSHRKYTGRCAPGLAILRAYVGGQLRADLLDLSDEEIAERCHRELSNMLHIQGRPKHVLVQRWPQAMALYQVGHLQRIDAIERQARQHPRLALLGNGYRGVGISDLVGAARARMRNFF